MPTVETHCAFFFLFRARRIPPVPIPIRPGAQKNPFYLLPGDAHSADAPQVQISRLSSWPIRITRSPLLGEISHRANRSWRLPVPTKRNLKNFSVRENPICPWQVGRMWWLFRPGRWLRTWRPPALPRSGFRGPGFSLGSAAVDQGSQIVIRVQIKRTLEPEAAVAGHLA